VVIEADSITIGAVGYGLAGIAFLLLTVVLLIGWKGGVSGTLLVTATLLSLAWALILARAESGADAGGPVVVLAMELLRNAAWLAFLWWLLRGRHVAAGGPRFGVVPLLGGVLLVAVVVQAGLLALLPFRPLLPWVLSGEVLLATGALVLVEHLYRTTPEEQRWAVKYLSLGVGGLFLYDFLLFSEALLFVGLHSALWDARGYVNALVVPLLAVSAARNPHWSLDVYVSRGIVLHGTTLLLAGGYLLVLAAAGYYLRRFGGEWGGVLQTVLLSAGALLLLVLLFSGQMRARLKVFLSKHFFNYRYDYREEWLRFIHTLARSDTPLPKRVIRAMTAIVESPGGQLWMAKEGDGYTAGTRLNWPEQRLPTEARAGALARYLHSSGWVIDLDEYRRYPDRYDGLALPSWAVEEPRLWLIVPLLHEERLLGFLTMEHSRAGQSLHWEERDLLKTAGRQAASYLAQMQTLQALAEAQQFEAFNRLSAYVIHDLKNLIAQLSLVVSNAHRHRDNPAFLKDAIATIEHAVERMNRLMQQLRGGARVANAETLDLVALAGEAVESRSGMQPIPRLAKVDEKLPVRAERERLLSVLNHLIQNAQEATPADGSVSLSAWCGEGRACLEVSDTGSGMDAAFLSSRLFRPFDSTKGLTGMGIGVYESREFLRALGGDLEVQSAPGRGSVFRILLPLQERAADGAELLQSGVA